MGLADRDYMRERARRREHGERRVRQLSDRPFTPPEPTVGSTLQYVFGFVALAYLCVKGFHWWADNHQPPPRPRAAISAPAPQVTPQEQAKRFPQLTGNWDPSRRVPTYERIPAPPALTVVTKCVANGRVTFSDGPCEAGASVSHITVNGSRNVADAQPVSPPPSTMVAPAQRLVAIEASPPTASPEGPDPAARQAECAFHEQAIQSIDVRARQPLGPAEQDWLSAKRKEHRDAQFRLHC